MPPFADRELPDDFNVVPIVQRKPQPPRKRKGAIAKITKDVKAGILEGAIACGADGEGLDGLSGYFRMCAKKYPKNYMHLLAKLMPLQIAGHGAITTPVSINVIGVPHDHYLSPEDIDRMRNDPLSIDHEPKFERHEQPAPEQTLSALEAKLLAMDPKELLELAQALHVGS